MINVFGNISLYISLFFVLWQIIKCTKKKYYFFKSNNIFILGLLLSLTISFFTLMLGYIISDFTILNVYQNSHSSKPLIYKITAVWGNHEGSMLLWLLVLSLFNYLIDKFLNQKNSKFIEKTLQCQGVIILGFLLFTIITSNPFQKIASSNAEGLGFNPILQDPILAIHPPFLYVGYVGFSAVFSLGIAVLTLTSKNAEILWFQYIKTFTMIAWSFLTAGIALGSIWAYYELGWGGWWFWDPVENASLMPWLLGTALLHSLMIVEKNKSLQIWILLLSILTFLLSIVGTFLVRSGILTSVHTFALDPDRGIYILIFMTILGGYSLLLLAKKTNYFQSRQHYSFLSKEGSILTNNILMIVVCATVFLGTIYPLMIETITGNKISVGEPYYNSTVIPIMIPGLIIMGIGPLLAWKKDSFKRIIKISLPSIVLTAFLTGAFIFFYKFINLLGLIGVILSFWIVSNSFLIFLYKKSYSPGSLIAHLGIGLLILGITGSSVWQQEKIVRLNLKDKVVLNKYTIIFQEINEIKAQNYVAIQGNFLVSKNGYLVTNLKPEKRFYPVTNIITTEASINTNFLRDLYITLGDGNPNKGWVISVYINPLVMWIWIGALLVFIGGIFTIRKNLK